jgi:hypothetical protein
MALHEAAFKRGVTTAVIFVSASIKESVHTLYNAVTISFHGRFKQYRGDAEVGATSPIQT